MSKKLNIFIIASILTVFSTASFADKGWRLFAGMEEGFAHEASLSVLLGAMGPDSKIGDSGLAGGIELSFNCPLIQPPTNKIRQQVSMTHYKDGDSDIKTIQINPHYVVEVMPKLWIGGGPGIGYVRADVNNVTSNMVAAQVGASVSYSIDKVFLGAEARYQFTQSDEVGGPAYNVDGASNWQTVIKVGYNFY